MNKPEAMGTSAFLRELIECFHESTIAYKNYPNGGKQFRYAQALKKQNSKALILLLNNIEMLPDTLQEDATLLITHYEIWSAKWDELAQKNKPAPGDIFVFNNTATFPKEAADHLTVYYESTKLQY